MNADWKAVWTIEWEDGAVKAFKKLGHPARQKIARYLKSRIATAQDPRRFGKPLQHNKKGLWRYRVDDYRILCSIEDEAIVILIVEIGHRRDIYE